MATVYLSNNTIRVAIGKANKKTVALKELYSTNEGEGNIINGTVVDKDLFAKVISDFWAKNNLPKKDITLVIDSTQFITKQIEAPIMKKKNLPIFVKNEFSTVERMNDPIYSYTTLYTDASKSSQFLFTAAAERTFVDTQIELFANAGVQIGSIRTALGCALGLLNRLSQVRDKSCLVQIFDDMDVTNILFVQGHYTYSSKTRLFEKKGTLAYAAEVSRTVSNIIQFVKARQIEGELTDVFMCGIGHEEFAICKNAIEIVSTSLTTSELDISSLVKGSAEVHDVANEYLYAVGGLFEVEKEADLLGQYKIAHRAKPKLKEAAKMARPVILLASLMGLVLGGLFVYRMTLTNKINKIYEFTRSPSVIASCEEYDKIVAETEDKLTYIDSITGTIANSESYPLPNSKAKAVLDRCAKNLAAITIKSYDSQTGILQVSSTAADVELINSFIKLLRAEDMFEYVTYTGYTYSEKDSKWIVNVVCCLSETAGKEVVAQ